MPTRVRYVPEGRGAYRTREHHFEPGDEATVADAVAARLTERDDFETVSETCAVEKSDGEVCGRELPCRYHSDD
jgi:hypothetical protein